MEKPFFVFKYLTKINYVIRLRIEIYRYVELNFYAYEENKNDIS